MLGVTGHELGHEEYGCTFLYLHGVACTSEGVQEVQYANRVGALEDVQLHLGLKSLLPSRDLSRIAAVIALVSELQTVVAEVDGSFVLSEGLSDNVASRQSAHFLVLSAVRNAVGVM